VGVRRRKRTLRHYSQIRRRLRESRASVPLRLAVNRPINTRQNATSEHRVNDRRWDDVHLFPPTLVAEARKDAG
jgi:hypothetical protein